ncbi:MAG: hypothetical protein R2687_06065 [Candidatus Nanopelagicales bacterium]
MNDPVTAWRALQEMVPDSAAWVESVMAAQQDAGFVYHGKAMLEVAEPTFVTASQVAADQHAAEAVVASLVAAGRLLLDDRDLQNTYIPGWLDGVPDADLFSLPSGYAQPIVFGRLDGVRTPDGLHFLEFNGGLPGGILPADGSADLLADTDLARAFGQQHPFRTATVGEDVLDALIDTWHDFGGGGLPYTVVAMPRELTDIATPALTYLSGLAQERGLEIAIADPGDLVFRDDRLRLDGREVDVLVRAFFTPMLAYLGERLDGIKAALRAGSLCMITSLQSGLFGLKSLFAMVTDPAVALDLSDEQLGLAREHLPWTRLVADGRSTDDQGEAVNLLGYLAARRDQLVIKPTDGYGGAGVELGWLHTDDSWAKVIADAAAGGHVAQQRVPIVTEHFSLLREGFPLQGFTADHNPLLCSGKLSGYYVRLAPEGGGLTNVTGGGATVAPTFIVD